MSKKKVILLIMDGIGISEKEKGNAVFHAQKLHLEYLRNTYPNTTLYASGTYVGLPENQMGNSEVGHLNIGAGRIVYTGLSLINKELETGEFYSNEAFLKAIQHAKENNSKVNIIGLVSKGGVHSSFEHIKALIHLLHKNGVAGVLHAFSDGRDVATNSFLSDLKELLPLLNECNVKLGSISGRYYGMDRDKNWSRNMEAYKVLIGESHNSFSSPIEYVEESYKNNVFDEMIVPALNSSYEIKDVTIQDNDSVIIANFRPDRSRQISHLIFDSNYYDFVPSIRRHNLFLVTLMKYEGIEPSMVAYELKKLPNVLGEVLEKNDLTQLRIAETEKYAHVTFFFDGGVENNYVGEEKIIIPSSKVATYDLKPEMEAYVICDKILERMNDFDVIIVNFANGDMVGHTGKFEATVKAVEVVDEVIGKIYAKAQETNTTLFITADHGNADVMLDDNDEVVTSHTINKVPFIVTDKSVELKSNLQLGNIAPTILDYLNVEIPAEMLEKITK